MTIHVMGAGGVGFWLGVALAREGVEFVIYDDDTLSGGLGYARLPKASPATYKVDLLRGFCVAVMGCKPPEIIKHRFDSNYIVTPAAGDLVIDCTDMELGARRKLWDWAKTNGARMLRVSYDGKNDTIAIAEGLPFASKPGGGYQEIPSLALSFMAGGLGALVVKRILAGHNQHVEFQVSVSDYFSIPEVPEVIVKKARKPK